MNKWTRRVPNKIKPVPSFPKNNTGFFDEQYYWYNHEVEMDDFALLWKSDTRDRKDIMKILRGDNKPRLSIWGYQYFYKIKKELTKREKQIAIGRR